MHELQRQSGAVDPGGARGRHPAVAAGAALALVTALSGAARAQAPVSVEGQTDADPRDAEAKNLCFTGRVDAGIALLMKLHAEANDPLYVYNQARCYQQNGRLDQAIEKFKAYLSLAGEISPAERAEAATRLSSAEQERDRSIRMAATPATAAPPTTSGAAPVTSLVGGGGREPTRLRPWAWAAGASGAALVGTGIYFGLRVRSLEDEAETLARTEGRLDPDADGRGQRAERWQWVGYGAGALALGAAAVLYWWPTRDEAPHGRAVAFMPLIGTRSAGGLVATSF